MSAVPPVGTNIQLWANQIVAYLRRSQSNLVHKAPAMTAAIDGTLIWDPVLGVPVVSIGGQWVKLKLDP